MKNAMRSDAIFFGLELFSVLAIYDQSKGGPEPQPVTTMQDGQSVKKNNETKNPKAAAQCAQESRRIVRARQRAIGRELRRFFDGVAGEPVPDDFIALLGQIDTEINDNDPAQKRR